MRKIVQWFACMLLCAAASGQAASAAFRTDSLVKLCKVWSEVKFSDPRLMLRAVDWDGALVRAIPKVREAQTNEQLAQAIGSMLAELSDPASRVFRRNASRSESAPITLFRWVGDLLVVNIGPYLDSIADEPLFSMIEPQAAIAAELPKATRVVFDVRTQGAETPGLILDNLTLVSEQVDVPAWRRVVRSGYPPASGPTAGGFYSALQVVVPPPLEGSGGEGGVPARTSSSSERSCRSKRPHCGGADTRRSLPKLLFRRIGSRARGRSISETGGLPPCVCARRSCKESRRMRSLRRAAGRTRP